VNGITGRELRSQPAARPCCRLSDFRPPQLSNLSPPLTATSAAHGRTLENVKKSAFSTNEKPNKWEEITTYNNYYEFGTDKDSPSMTAHSLKPEPWTVAVDGECNKKGTMQSVVRRSRMEIRIGSRMQRTPPVSRVRRPERHHHKSHSRSNRATPQNVAELGRANNAQL
jgi:hypothetical protein